MDGSLERLPDATASKIRSMQILTSLSQVVSELLQNSIDAGASHIEVGVDAENWSCWVRDDGSGMTKDSLMKLVGNEHSESRYGTLF